MSLHHDDSQTCGLCFAKLRNAHPYLVDWFWRKKKLHPELHVSWAHRDKADQDLAFANGATRAKWPNSPHNKLPSLALDIFLVDADGIARFPLKFYQIIDKENQDNKEPIFWGGNIKLDGQGGRPDGNHFELIVSKLPAAQEPATAIA